MKGKQKLEVLNNGAGRIALAFARLLTTLPSHSEEERSFFPPTFLFQIFLSYAGKRKVDDCKNIYFGGYQPQLLSRSFEESMYD